MFRGTRGSPKLRDKPTHLNCSFLLCALQKMKFLVVVVLSLLSNLAVAKLEDGDCEGTQTTFTSV